MKFKEFLKKIFYMVADFNPFLYRPEYKISGHKLEIHKNDKDIWPSYPHIHILDDSLKLDIYTGELYRIQTKQQINELSDKDMKKIWNDQKFLKIVMDARKDKPINVGELKEIPFKWIDDKNKEWIKGYESNNN